MRTRVRPLPLAVASAVVLAVGIGAWSPASQADTTPAACTTVGPSLTDFTAVLTLPKFDPALGTLTAVTISGSEQVTMRIRVENEGPVPAQLGGDLTAIGTLTLPTGETAMTSSAYSRTEMLPAYDGATDWAGSGFNTGPVVADNQITPIQVTGSGVASYVGPGTFDSTYLADGNSTFDGPGVSSYWFESNASATVCVSYAYSVATTTTTVPPTTSTTSTTLPPSSTTTAAPTTTTTTPRTTTTVAPTTSTTTSTTAPCTTTTTAPTSTSVPSTTPLSTTTVPGTSSTTSTSLPAWCVPPSTTSTTAPATTTTVRPTPSTVAPVPGPTSSSTTVEAVVSPTTLDAPPAVPSLPVPVPTSARSLPRTGSDPRSTVLIGAGLLGTGISLLVWRRGRRAATTSA